MLADGVVDQGGALGFVANVYWMEIGFAALVADCGGGFFAAILLDVGQDYRGTFGGGLAGAGEAYALGGAGDQDNFVLEAVGHGERKSTVDSLQLKAKPKIGNRKNLTQRARRAQRNTEKNLDGKR